MGEVYRADDLKLGQTVALKFLPEAVAQDGAALARFHREVRIARQVSHASVCRVFDIGEVEGLPFLTMEYVDGEDLASLMRRIGRLSPDKALELSRQICAGLAAAHEHGILHRDLKPANIMLDGRGKARITDFGLAGLADELREEDARAGTPAYMSPEQLSGKEVTTKSDIYALGLVLYELFTGKRAYEAASMKELVRLRESGTLSSPSAVAKDVDPLVERVILRCLEKDPAKRPATALQVAAALPGGDPLAAALAAGETPSPEMVAAAGGTEGLKPQAAWACLIATLILLACGIFLNQRIKLFRCVPFEKPPEVLVERAREIEKRFGYTTAPADFAYGFATDGIFLQDIAARDQSKTRWNNLDRGEVKFWYRGSPRLLEAVSFFGPDLASGEVTWWDPPMDISGMTLVRLNPRGRLLEFQAVAPQVEGAAPSKPGLPDWGALFDEAGFDLTKWTPTEPQWTPNTYCDARAAWLGVRPDRPNEPLRIEAAAYRGKPVYFYIVGPWSRPGRMQEYKGSAAQRASNVILLLIFLALMIGAAVCARYNLQRGRGDRRGAFRLAAFVFVLMAVSWLLRASHVANLYELGLFIMFMSWALFVTGLLWLIYIALEPFVRRMWPAAIVSWSRLLAGGWRDPLVGRDILAGCLGAALFAAMGNAASLLPRWLGHPPQQPDYFPLELLLGARRVIGYSLWQLAEQIFVGLALMFLMLFLRWVLRKQWLAAAAVVVLMTALNALQSSEPLLVTPFVLLIWALLVIVLVRFGLVAITALFVFDLLLDSFPITTDTSAWYAGVGYLAIMLMAALTFYGFRISLGGKSLFGGAAQSA
jgi:serine/threonine-protein kinase